MVDLMGAQRNVITIRYRLQRPMGKGIHSLLSYFFCLGGEEDIGSEYHREKAQIARLARLFDLDTALGQVPLCFANEEMYMYARCAFNCIICFNSSLIFF